MICNISLHMNDKVRIIYNFKSQPNVLSKMSEKFLVWGQITNSGSFGVILGHNFEIFRKPSKLYMIYIHSKIIEKFLVWGQITNLGSF